MDNVSRLSLISQHKDRRIKGLFLIEKHSINSPTLKGDDDNELKIESKSFSEGKIYSV